MNRWRAAAALLIATAPLGSAAAGAQDDGSESTEAGNDALAVTDVDLSAEPEVSFTISGPIALIGEDLTDRFEIRESGELREATIEPLPSDDLQVLLLMDTSGSMAGPAMDEARAAATTFIDQMPDAVSIAVVGFGTTPTLAADFTTDHEAAKAAVATLQPVGETALYDGLIAAVDLFPDTTEARQLIVLLTDGGDTVSVAALDDAVGALRSARIPLSTISLTTSESDPEALGVLGELPRSSLVPVADETALQGAFDQVASILVNRYRVTFETKGAGPTAVTAVVAASGEYWAGGFLAQLRIPVIPPTPTPTARPTPTPTTPPVVIAAPAVTTGVDPGRTWLLPLGICLLAVAMAAFFHFILWPSRRASVLREYARQARAAAAGPRRLVPNFQDGLVNASNRLLRSNERDQRLGLRLAQAGIAMRAGEFVALVMVFSVLAFLVGLLVHPVVALLLALSVVLVAWMVVSIKRARRQKALQEQLSPTLQMLAGSLRTGYSLAQATAVVGDEAQEPTRSEFSRIATENRLGRDLASSYRDSAIRSGSDDFLWVADAIEVNQTIGGDLAELLDNVAATLRARDQVKRQVQTLTAEGRISALILGVLPFAVFGWLVTFNQAYAESLVGTSQGRSILLLCGFLLGVGLTWLYRITKLRY